MIKKLIEILESHPQSKLQIRLPSGNCVPDNFHITEVGRVQKTFIDCGGTQREFIYCVLQVWTAHDTEHRLLAGKLAKILRLAENVLKSDTLPIELEYGNEVISRYLMDKIEVLHDVLLISLKSKQTECLAIEKCVYVSNSCCSDSSCC